MRKNTVMYSKYKHRAIVLGVLVLVLTLLFATDFWADASNKFEKFWLK